jgi:ribulose-phosphate 3-epimerase
MSWREWARDVEIEPSLYAADFANLGSQIEELLEAGARIFHFDMGDGHFVEPVTIGPIVIESIAPIVHSGGGVLDCHLMVERPEKHFPQIADAGGDSVTFHVEACSDPASAIASARTLGLGAGIAFNPETSVGRVLAAAEGIDLVLCMSIHPGYSGQPFMEATYGRVERLRAALPEGVHIQVDGGVGETNIKPLHERGVTLLVAASAIFSHDDIAAAYQRLVHVLA